jgi:transposase
MTIAVYDHAPKPPGSLDPATTITAVVELSKRTWLVGGHVPGLERRPLKKTEDRAAGLLRILTNWRKRAEQAGRSIAHIVVAFEAGRDGFWLARWLRRTGIEAFVIHPSSIPVPRGARVKTDRIDTGMLLRAFSAWLRGEPDACRMVAIPAREEEDLRRPSRERAELVTERTRLRNRIRSLLTVHGLSEINPNSPATFRKLEQLRTAEGEPLPPHARAEIERLFERLALVKNQIKVIEADYARRTVENKRVEGEHSFAAQARRRFQQLVTVTGMGAATAATLVAEVFMRNFADRRALARFVGLTGTPDESGSRRRDRGLMKAGSARVRHIMIQLAWRMLYHQPNSALVQWYRDRVAKANSAGRKTFIVALARKLLIALWRFVQSGQVPEGMRLATV